MTHLQLRHGELVEPGRVRVGCFLREVTEKRGNQRYSGSWEELEKLVEDHMASSEPGFGSVDGDVLLVRVPSAGFFTDIVKITPQNASEVFSYSEARVEGEAPVTKHGIVTPPAPAAVVKIVIYRADTLARDAGRSTDAEWEIVAINAQPQEHVPMHPTTMERNSRHATGGTHRVYGAGEWREARAFWATHAYAKQERPAEAPPVR